MFIRIVGSTLLLIALVCLYKNDLVAGGIIFSLGGFIAKGLYLSIRSGGLILMVVSIPYGYHNEFDPVVLFLIFVGFVLANFTTKRTSSSSEWGFDIDFSGFGSGSDGAGGDCGGGD